MVSVLQRRTPVRYSSCQARPSAETPRPGRLPIMVSSLARSATLSVEIRPVTRRRPPQWQRHQHPRPLLHLRVIPTEPLLPAPITWLMEVESFSLHLTAPV